MELPSKTASLPKRISFSCKGMLGFSTDKLPFDSLGTAMRFGDGHLRAQPVCLAWAKLRFCVLDVCNQCRHAARLHDASLGSPLDRSVSEVWTSTDESTGSSLTTLPSTTTLRDEGKRPV
jgi:hypothetical protein